MAFTTAEHNPLATERLHGVPFRFETGTWETHLVRLAELDFRAAIVGHRGSGKSTLLRGLLQRLPASGIRASYFSFPFEVVQRKKMLVIALQQSRSGSVLLIDGIERLSWRQRFQLLAATKTNSGLVIAQHRTGRLPTWWQCRTSIALLHDVLSDLNLHDPAIISAGEREFAKYNGNIRDALRELYDQLARGDF